MSKKIDYEPERIIMSPDETAETSENQYESGMMLLKSIMEHREAIFSALAEMMQADRSQNLVNNLGSIYKFLSELDSEWFSGTLDRISRKVKEIPGTEGNVSGIMGFLRVIKEPNISSGLNVVMNLLSALSPAGKNEK